MAKEEKETWLEGIADIVSLRHETNLRLERNDIEEGVDSWKKQNSSDQIFIKIAGFSSFYDRFIIDTSLRVAGDEGRKLIDPDVGHVVLRFRHGDEIQCWYQKTG